MISERQNKLLEVLRSGVVVSKEYAIDCLGYKGDKHDDIINCRELYQDIIEINNDDEVEEIIVVNHNKFKIANEEEAVAYMEKIMSKALKQFARYWKLVRKFSKNEQYDLLKDKFIESIEKSC